MSDEIKSLVIDEARYETRLTTKFERRKPYIAPDPRQVFSTIPGAILEVNVRVGQKVKWGETLLILEAMKMSNAVCAPQDGTIKTIHVRTGDRVQKRQLLLELE